MFTIGVMESAGDVVLRRLSTALLTEPAATPATRDNTPVGTPERGVTQSVEDRVDRTVDVAQPVP